MARRGDGAQGLTETIHDAAVAIDGAMGVGYAGQNPSLLGDVLISLAVLELARQVDRVGGAVSNLDPSL